jgi:hypothetical protein
MLAETSETELSGEPALKPKWSTTASSRGTLDQSWEVLRITNVAFGVLSGSLARSHSFYSPKDFTPIAVLVESHLRCESSGVIGCIVIDDE